MILSLADVAMRSLIEASPKDAALHSIIQTTFTGQKLELTLDQLFEALELIKNTEEGLSKTKLIQYGLMTTIVENAEKHISMLAHTEQLTYRGKLYQAFKDEGLPLPSKEVMLSNEGGHVSAVGTSNIKNGTYNIMLRRISENHYTLILDLDLHHPGLEVVNKTLPLLNPSILEEVFFWKKNDKDDFYQRIPVKVFGGQSQIVQYQENHLDVYIERGFDDKILTDKPRLTISITGFEENNLESAQAVLKHTLFRLGLGSITYPQRPVDRERTRIFSANRAKHLRNNENRLCSYDEERNLNNYDLSLTALKNMLNANVAELAFTSEEEILPGKIAWVYPLLETKMTQNKIKFLYHSFCEIERIKPVETGKRMRSIFSEGIQSTMHRYRHGIFINGISSSGDMLSGGGNSVFTRTRKNDNEDWIINGGHKCLFIIDTSCTRLVNTYMFKKDSYGSKEESLYSMRQAPYEITQEELDIHNELMVKYVIPPHAIIGLYITSDYYKILKTHIDKAIIESEILNKRGKSLEQFIVHSTHDINSLIENHHNPKQIASKSLYVSNIEENAKRRKHSMS